MADYEDHGWIEEDDIDSYMKDPIYKMMRQNQSIKEKDTLDDIFQNTMHILGRCNNPDDWGEEDKRGLVYGMIQSGKTASMIDLIASGMKAGYKVFIVLAGDKNSLRCRPISHQRIVQSRQRSKSESRIHSPTFDGDFDDSDPSAQNSAFKFYHRIKNGVGVQYNIRNKEEHPHHSQTKGLHRISECKAQRKCTQGVRLL